MQAGLTRILFTYLFFSITILSVAQNDLSNMAVEFLFKGLNVKIIGSSSANSGSSFSLFKKILTMLPVKRIIVLGILGVICKKFKIDTLLKKLIMGLAVKESVKIVSQKYGYNVLQSLLGKWNKKDTNPSRKMKKDGLFPVKKKNETGAQNKHPLLKQKEVAVVHKAAVSASTANNSQTERHKSAKVDWKYQLSQEDDLTAIEFGTNDEDTRIVKGVEDQISGFAGEFLSQQASSSASTSNTLFYDSTIDNKDTVAAYSNGLRGTMPSAFGLAEGKDLLFASPVATEDNRDRFMRRLARTPSITQQRSVTQKVDQVENTEKKGNWSKKFNEPAVGHSVREGSLGQSVALCSLADDFLLEEGKGHWSSSQPTSVETKSWADSFYDGLDDVMVVGVGKEEPSVSHLRNNFDEKNLRVFPPWLAGKDNESSEQDNYDDHRDAGVKPTFVPKNEYVFEIIKHCPQFSELVPDRFKLKSFL